MATKKKATTTAVEKAPTKRRRSKTINIDPVKWWNKRTLADKIAWGIAATSVVGLLIWVNVKLRSA